MTTNATRLSILTLGSLLLLLLAAAPLAAQVGGPQGDKRSFGPAQWPQSVKMADFILSVQDAGGAIQDYAGSGTVNHDSNMQYALIGLGAAYAHTSDAKYLTGLEKGIRWLAARQETQDPEWKGSWYYVFSSRPPYAPIQLAEGPGILDVRGVDATSTLFVYLLYLHSTLSRRTDLVSEYATTAKLALDFVAEHSIDTDGLSWSSWHKRASDGQWHRYAVKYAADQGDVFLGMKAGALLYKSDKYKRIADVILAQTTARLFSQEAQRYATSMDASGKLQVGAYMFAQGYLSWMWGDLPQNRAALKWLRSRVQADGSVASQPGGRASSLNVAMLGMASRGLREPAPSSSFDWLIRTTYDSATGGVRGTANATSRQAVNEAAFILMSMMGFVPFQPAGAR